MPPALCVAVNVTEVPGHIVVEDAVMLTAGIAVELSVIVMLLPVAMGEVIHEALLVSTQLTTSLLLSEAEVNEGLFVPAFWDGATGAGGISEELSENRNALRPFQGGPAAQSAGTRAALSAGRCGGASCF